MRDGRCKDGAVIETEKEGDRERWEVQVQCKGRGGGVETRLDRMLVCRRLSHNLVVISENLHQTGLVFRITRAEVTGLYRRADRASVGCI
jgi:hypothetical protein